MTNDRPVSLTSVVC